MGKVLLKLTSRKTLALSNVLYVPSIRVNLIFVALLGKIGVKYLLNLTRLLGQKIMFLWEKEYCDQGLFVLNIYEIFNKSSSYAYFVDLYDMWHSRLGHVNHLCVMELQRL